MHHQWMQDQDHKKKPQVSHPQVSPTVSEQDSKVNKRVFRLENVINIVIKRGSVEGTGEHRDLGRV